MLGFIAATLMGIIGSLLFTTEELMMQPWIDDLYRSLIATGFIMAYLNWAGDWLRCNLCGRRGNRHRCRQPCD